MKTMRILTEACGSLVAAYLIRAIQDAGHIAVASDIDEENAGRYLADDFIEMPSVTDPDLWTKIECLLVKHRVDAVIPSFDDTLVGWAERREAWRDQLGVSVILSSTDTIRTFRDKWKTYCFFKGLGIRTPRTSCEQEFPLVKPRFGRGGQGVSVPAQKVDMDGMISQELLHGKEYTVDVLCDSSSAPIYIVPRRRLRVTSGKSVDGIVELVPGVVEPVRSICHAARLQGPVNMQLFIDENGSASFTEVNPRVAGGMALGFAATENWVPLLVNHFVDGRPICPGPVKYGLKMYRYYAECFISNR